MLHTIVPDWIPRRVEEYGSEDDRRRARRDLAVMASIRARRDVAPPPVEPNQGESREIRDAGGRETTTGVIVRAEDSQPSGDEAADLAYNGFGATYRTLFDGAGRRSFDGANAKMVGIVHYGEGWNNAAWDGRLMLFGDGDGVYFRGFAQDLGVVAHELGHAVTQYTANLRYQGQPGALNESWSDVIGTLVKQFALGQTVHDADWLIGETVFTDRVQGRALRDMRNPGTAYDDPVIGKDPQPAHMKDLYRGSGDNGGVHINSGIPNRAFYLAVRNIGGDWAWDAGLAWYRALTTKLGKSSDFAAAAQATVAAAEELFGADSFKVKAIREAWVEVGVVGQPAPEPDPCPGWSILSSDVEFMRLLREMAALPSVRRVYALLRGGVA